MCVAGGGNKKQLSSYVGHMKLEEANSVCVCPTASLFTLLCVCV